MPEEKANKKKTAAKAVEVKTFFYPTIENGVGIEAASKEEADAIVKERFGV